MNARQRGSATGLTVFIIVAILIAASMLFYSNRRTVSTLPPEFYQPVEPKADAVVANSQSTSTPSAATTSTTTPTQ